MYFSLLIKWIGFFAHQIDKKTNKPKIWLFKDKNSGAPKGEATITYDDPSAATAAIQWFNGQPFNNGPNIKVSMATRKNNFGGPGGFRGARGGRGGMGGGGRGGDRDGGGFGGGGRGGRGGMGGPRGGGGGAPPGGAADGEQPNII